MWIVCVPLFLTTCSGGETGTGENKDPQQSSARSTDVTSIGPITAFGSVFVNGVEFDTSEAYIEANGLAVSEHALTQGMLVKIDGHIDDSGRKGVAYSISYCSILDGAVDLVERDSVTGNVTALSMLGQRVVFDKSTLVDSQLSAFKSIDDIHAGFHIEVSGYQGLNEILATHVEIVDSVSDQLTSQLLTGAVAEANVDYFRINDLLIYYDDHTVLEQLDAGIRSGIIVAVVGHWQASDKGSIFIADRVTLDSHNKTDKMLELEGYVVEALNQGLMRVNRFMVSLAADIDIENGDLASLAEVGTKLQIDGHLTANGVLEAHHIEIKRIATVKFVSNLQKVDADQNSFVVFARRVFIDNHTIIKDESSQSIKAINLSHFSIGDRIDSDMHYDVALNRFIATKLQRIEASTDSEKLKGPLLSVHGKGANIMVNIAGLELELASPDAHLFYNREIGTMVSVTGSYNSLDDVFEVSEVQFGH